MSTLNMQVLKRASDMDFYKQCNNNCTNFKPIKISKYALMPRGLGAKLAKMLTLKTFPGLGLKIIQ